MTNDSSGYYTDVDEARDNYSSYTYYNWGERRALPRKKSSSYIKAKNAKVGDFITCANCSKKVIKKAYQQKFCCNECKVKYHNRRFK